MRREVVVLLMALLLFNTAYSVLHPGVERSTLRKIPHVENLPTGGPPAVFNLSQLRIGETKFFTTSFYASLSSPDGTFNFTQWVHLTGQSRAVGYATREDARLNPVPSVMLEESREGSMKTTLVTSTERHTGEGSIKTSTRRFLSLEDLSPVRLEVTEEYTGEGSRQMKEVAVLYPEGESYSSLISRALENLTTLRQDTTYTAEVTLDPNPLPLPPIPFRLSLTAELSGRTALIRIAGAGASLTLQGFVVLEDGFYFPRGINLTVSGELKGYRVLLKYSESAPDRVAGKDALIHLSRGRQEPPPEVLPFEQIPEPGEGYNGSLYGGSPEEVLRALESFLEGRGEALKEVHRVVFQLNTTASSPLWNISFTSREGEYFAVMDPESGEVLDFGPEKAAYLESKGASRGITLSAHHRILKSASPAGFFNRLGEPNPTLKIYLYRDVPLASLPGGLMPPLPPGEGFFLSVAADPMEPGRILFISVSLSDGRVLASGSVEGSIF